MRPNPSSGSARRRTHPLTKERTMPISRLSRWTLALLIIGLVGACQSDEAPEYPEAPDRIEPLAVQNASASLQATIRVEAADVQVRVPTGWVELDSTAAARAHRSVAVDPSAVQTQPLRVVGEQRTSSFLTISRVSVASGEEVGAAVQRAVRAQFPSFERVDTLQVDGQPLLIDFVIAPRSAVHHKVLMTDTDTTAVQFDFVTPRFQYPRIVSLIEASVASIRRGE